MTVFIALDGWELRGEDNLLAWLASEARSQSGPASVNFILVDDEDITSLNEQFLQHEGPTDVIAFDLRQDNNSEGSFGEGERSSMGLQEMSSMEDTIEPEIASDSVPGDDFPDAEVYVSLETARAQAIEYNCTVTEEVSRLMLHGLLHLSGFRDDDVDHRRIMAEHEDAGLNRAGREIGVLAWQFIEPVEQRG